jgi:N,N'-diacetylchitobiose phosphorylase
MQFGHFDNKRKEYVITRPDTPRSWSNYLGSIEYGAIITNNAGGYSFWRSAARGRFTRIIFNNIPMDQPGRYFYIRDKESGDYWSSSWQPVSKPLEQYKTTCRHGTAYTIIDSNYSGILSESTYFVPLDRLYECWVLKITNESKKPRKLSVFTFVEFASEWNILADAFNQQYSQHIIDCGMTDGMISYVMHPNLAGDPADPNSRVINKHLFFGLVGVKASGFDTDRDIFLGPHRTYANPIVVEKGKCTGSRAYGDNGCGTFQIDIELSPKQSEEFAVVMGVGSAAYDGKKALAEFSSIDKVHDAFTKVKQKWHSRLGVLNVDSPDNDFNSMVNVWNPYNCLVTFAWSRAASLVYTGERDGLGYRDTVQDILGSLSAIPEETRERLELMITGQCSNGGAISLIKAFEHHPGKEKTPTHYRSDDCLWLFNTVPAYVKETGDLSLYEKVLPYADEGEDTVFGHLRRAIEFNLERSGSHGLPCGLGADWNDCLNLGVHGESVFVAFQLRYGLTVYAEIAEILGKPHEVVWANNHLKKLDENIQKYTWDGEWFIRALREDGRVIGRKIDPEGSIFLNAQSWAIISGAATTQQAKSAMNSVYKRMFSEYGLTLLEPPFKKVTDIYGGVVYPAGMKENASIFNHTQGWAVIAETMLGCGDRAYEYYRAYMPSAFNNKSEIRQIEPYVHCQWTHSRHSRRFGAGRIPWLTGTAAWSYYAATQYILGIRPDYRGLRIDPCLPSKWKHIRVRRKFRGMDFNITINNGAKGKGVKRMRLNGEDVKDNLLLVDRCKKHNEVFVELY